MIISVQKFNNIHNDGENNGTSEARLLRCVRIRLRWEDGEQAGAHGKLLPLRYLDQKVGHILDVLCVVAERTAALDLHPNLLVGGRPGLDSIAPRSLVGEDATGDRAAPQAVP